MRVLQGGGAGRVGEQKNDSVFLKGWREREREARPDSPDESDRATEEDGVENVGVPTAESGRGGKVNVVDVDPTEPVDPREEERIVAAKKGAPEVRVRGLKRRGINETKHGLTHRW